MQHKIFTGSVARQIDRLAIDSFGYTGLSLMKKAGESAFSHIRSRVQTGQPKGLRMLVLCGGGNNGGDGYVVARCALLAGWRVTLIAYAAPSSRDAQAVAAEFSAAGGVAETPADADTFDACEVVVDALLGVGISGAPRGLYATAIEAANRLPAFKVAIDVPSGIDADSGFAHHPNFRADLTVTYIALKLGVLTGPATNSVGELVLEDLELDRQVTDQVAECANLLGKPTLPRRQSDSHKGKYGHVIITGGDNGMFGAVLLAGKAALRCGCGKVHILSTDAHLDKPSLYSPELMSAVFENRPSELMQNAQAIVVGPGLGTNSWGREVFEHVVKTSTAPLVIDADALTLLAESGYTAVGNKWVLTPHPGEAARLLKCSVADIQSNRLDAVRQIANQYHCLCVLKGAGTLIADSHSEVSLCNLGNAGMATAGMGDVLSGMIAAFIGQGMALRPATETAVWLHSYSADAWVKKHAAASLIASDILDHLPTAMAMLAYDQACG
ncbi:MAG: NAD(P)H-hydrate dehydratase [Gammaproteobacteria bacterium]|nr:NAD(P)H-hydrate dehydratase [Gammaproteobacteria bacterium]